jgi:hypothetical protein
MATLREVRVKGLLHPHSFPSPTGIAAAMALDPGRIAALRLPPPQGRPQRVHLPRDESTRLLRLVELLTLKRHHRAIMPSRWPPRNSGDVIRSLLAPSGAERWRNPRHHRPYQVLLRRPWRGLNCC